MRVNLAGVLSGRPLLITEQGLRLVFAVVSRNEFFAHDRMQALAAHDGEPLENTHAVEVRDGVAVIPIHGPLFRFGNFFTEISGATSYDTIRKDLQAALDDTNIKAILLDVNSPGGDADGCGELAEAIRAACSIKPVWAYVGGMGASAAYWLSSAAQRIHCAPSAFLGSIGVRTAIVDDSVRDQREGVREIEIISSNAPGKRDRPVDDEIIAKTQKHVDDLEALFVGAVAQYRGTSPDVVMEKFGRGDVVIGGDAVKAGMADELSNYEDTLAALAAVDSTTAASTASAQAATQTTRTNMAKKNPFRAEGAPPEPMPAGKKAEGDKDMPGCEDQEPDKSADAAEGEGDEDDEQDKEPMAADDSEDQMAEEEKDEKAMAKTLAAKLGLPATASMKEILTAAAAASVPLSKMSVMVEKQVAERFAAEQKRREKQEAKDRAEKLAASAIRGGYDPADKKALIEFATTNFAAAERSVAHFLKNADQLYGRVVPASTERPSGQSDVQVKQMGGVRVVKYGVSLSAEAKALAAKEKISYEAALDRVVKERPELYQSYLTQLS